MRALFFIVILLPAQVWAAQFLTEVGIDRIQEGKKNVTIYGDLATCEQREPDPCFDVSGFDIDVISIATVAEVDPTKPIYKAPSNITPCADEPSCSALITPKAFCPNGEFGRFGDLEPDGQLEGWCTKILSYATKQETKVVIDPVKKAAKDAKLAEEANAIGRLKDTGEADIDGANNIQQLKPILKDMLKVLLDGAN